MKTKPFLIVSLATALALVFCGRAQAYTIGFENVSVPGVYPGSSEGGFTITPTFGTWSASATGNPGNSIRPLSSLAQIEITDGTFTFASFQYFNDGFGVGSYNLEGFLNGNSVFNAGGPLPGVGSWNTLSSPDSVSIIDTLRIRVINSPLPDDFTRIDNIIVDPASLPVPDSGGSLILLGLGLTGLICWRFRTGKISPA